MLFAIVRNDNDFTPRQIPSNGKPGVWMKKTVGPWLSDAELYAVDDPWNYAVNWDRPRPVRFFPIETKDGKVRLLPPADYAEGCFGHKPYRGVLGKIWMKDGYPHRDVDLPAVIDEDGCDYWCIDGLLHREGDKPSVESLDGDKLWFWRGVKHRDGDKPAEVRKDYIAYYKNGIYHRDGDKPAFIDKYQTMFLKFGLLHRDSNLPAVVMANGKCEWWVRGKQVYPHIAEDIHRERTPMELLAEASVGFSAALSSIPGVLVRNCFNQPRDGEGCFAVVVFVETGDALDVLYETFEDESGWEVDPDLYSKEDFYWIKGPKCEEAYEDVERIAAKIATGKMPYSIRVD